MMCRACFGVWGMPMKKICYIFACAAVFVCPGMSRLGAVNFYDGVRAPDGLYLLNYFSWYRADELVDNNGERVSGNYGYTKTEGIFRLAYYHSGLVVTALLPVGGVYVNSVGDGSFGIGDITAGAGFFLPIGCLDVLPMLFVKFPSGEFDADSAVNYGSGQYDLRPLVYVHKSVSLLTVDCAAKYHYRFENRDTGVRLGNEMHLQAVAGWLFFDAVRFGPSVSWMKAFNRELDGEEVSGTGRRVFSAGADLSFRAQSAGVTLTWLADAFARNSTRGNYIQVKTVLQF